MKTAAFEDEDLLKVAFTKLETHSKDMIEKLKDKNKKIAEDALILEVLEEVQELIEQSEQNYSNLCKMGGMPILLKLIVTHDSEPVRVATCRTFTTMNSNKLKVQ